jgi:hypothetical protein
MPFLKQKGDSGMSTGAETGRSQKLGRLYARIAGGLYCGVFIASVVRTWVCHLPGIFRIRLLHQGIPDRPLEVLPRLIGVLLAIEGLPRSQKWRCACGSW